MTLNPDERALLAKAAAHTSWAKTEDKSARTSNARAARDQKFLDAAGGDPEKAAHLRTAYFTNLAAKSAITRRKAREARKEAARVEKERASVEREWSGAIRLNEKAEVPLAERIARAIEAEAQHATPGTKRIIAMCAGIARREGGASDGLDYDRLAAAIRAGEERYAHLRTSALDGRRRGPIADDNG